MIPKPNTEFFEFSGQEKKYSLIFIIAGLVLAAIGLLTNLDNPTRLWTGLLYNNFFFLALGVTATFFIASQTLGYNGWYVLIKRVPEAMMTYVPIGGVLMLVILFLGLHNIYHWSHVEAGYYDPTSPHYDELLSAKQPYLNAPFFFVRSITYIAVFSLFAWLLRRNSLSSDTTQNLNIYNRSIIIGGIFIVFFAVFSSTSSWDWFMSIQPHWYSTLFGWYCFISMFVTTIAFIILFLQYLKSKGYVKHVTHEHFHDLGKLMFAFSVAWAYLFFSQFMLIWYGNIPEETMYYKLRNEHYQYLMYTVFVLNFATPFFVLISAGAKRHRLTLIFGALVIIVGHWLDFYQMSMPAALHENHQAPAHVGFWEIGLGLTFLGVFTYVVFNSLSKASLIPVNHPFVKESWVHHT